MRPVVQYGTLDRAEQQRPGHASRSLLYDAADEIERLRGEGEWIKGFAEPDRSLCSCGNSDAWSFNADCGHFSGRHPAILILHTGASDG